MIKQIIWDFDGVIIFSDEIREEGFREVLMDYEKSAVEQMLLFHRANGGLSRYVKFKYLLEDILGNKPNEQHIQQLAEKFSKIMKVKMVDASKINEEAIKFIINTQGEIIHHIASGSDEDELRFLCKELRIEKLFSSIQGSPMPKNELVSEILISNKCPKELTCLIGDAVNDYQAALINNIRFYGYNNPILKKYSKSYIESFQYFNIYE